MTDPRTIIDILFRGLTIHIFAICAYAHLGALQSWNRSGRLDMLQIIVFALFPEFVLVKLSCDIAVVLLNYTRTARKDAPISYYVSGMLGMYVSTTEDPYALNRPVIGVECSDLKEEVLPRDSTWIYHLVFVVLNAIPVTATIFAYIQRFGIRYRAATDVGNLGFDHRNAWIAIGGSISALLSLIILLQRRRWIFNSLQSRAIETQTGAERFRITTFAQTMWACVIHQVLLGETNHFTKTQLCIMLLIASACACCSIMATLVGNRYSGFVLATTYIGFVFLANAVVTDFAVDVYELYNAAHGRVEAYNYRWKVKDFLSTRARASV